MIGVIINSKLLFKLYEKNFVKISEKEIKIIPNTKIFILNFEYPIEFFDFIKSNDDIIANNGIYKGLNSLLKNSCDKLFSCFGPFEH